MLRLARRNCGMLHLTNRGMPANTRQAFEEDLKGIGPLEGMLIHQASMKAIISRVDAVSEKQLPEMNHPPYLRGGVQRDSNCTTTRRPSFRRLALILENHDFRDACHVPDEVMQDRYGRGDGAQRG